MPHDHRSRPAARLLLVDDDESLVEVMEVALARQGYQFCTARTGEQALAAAATFKPHVVLLDIMLPDQSGYLVAAKLKLCQPAPRIVILTALPRGQSDRWASFLSADCILHKPVPVSTVLAALERQVQAGPPAAA